MKNLTPKTYKYLTRPKVVQYITTKWCSHCKPVERALIELGKKYKEVVFIKTDWDKNEDYCMNKLGIRSVPTILFMKHGSVIDKLVGEIAPKQIEQKIKDWF